MRQWFKLPRNPSYRSPSFRDRQQLHAARGGGILAGLTGAKIVGVRNDGTKVGGEALEVLKRECPPRNVLTSDTEQPMFRQRVHQEFRLCRFETWAKVHAKEPEPSSTGHQRTSSARLRPEEPRQPRRLSIMWFCCCG